MSASINYNAVSTYLAGNMAHTDPAQIIVLLYEGAINRVSLAVQEMMKQNALASGIAVYRALSIIGELRKSLNLEAGGEISKNLDLLYLYMHEELVRGHLSKQPEPLEQVRKLLTDLHDAWKQAVAQSKQSLGTDTGVVPPAATAGRTASSQTDPAPRLALRA